MVVHFQQGVRFLGSQYQFLKVQFSRAVARMTDDVHLRMLDNLDETFGVLILRTTLIPCRVNTRNNYVQSVQILFCEVEPSVVVEDVHFTPHQQLDTIHLSGHHKHVSEIHQRTGARHTWTVFRDTQDFQSFVGSGFHHFLQTAVGMSRGYRVCMSVNKNLFHHQST